MPKSGTTLGDAGIASGVPITIDTVDRYAREIGFEGRYQLNLPQGDTGRGLDIESGLDEL